MKTNAKIYGKKLKNIWQHKIELGKSGSSAYNSYDEEFLCFRNVGISGAKTIDFLANRGDLSYNKICFYFTGNSYMVIK